MSAFWKPFAYQEQGELDEEALKAIAQDSIEALTRQIDLIRQSFGIERPEAAGHLKDEIRQALREVLQEMSAGGGISITSQTPPADSSHLPAIAKPNPAEIEGVDFDEDVLLGDLFENTEIAA